MGQQDRKGGQICVRRVLHCSEEAKLERERERERSTDEK